MAGSPVSRVSCKRRGSVVRWLVLALCTEKGALTSVLSLPRLLKPVSFLPSACHCPCCFRSCKHSSTSCSINPASFWNSLQLPPFPTLQLILAICWAGPHGNSEPVCLDHHLSPVPGPGAPSRHSHVPALSTKAGKQLLVVVAA